MKKKPLKMKFEYWLDSLMEQGTVVMILLLFLVVIIISCITGIIVSLTCGVSFDEGIWNSLMHTLDAGNLAGNDLGNKANIVLMTVMTAFGLCVTGGLIGILNNSFEQKVRDWQKGSSKVMEKGHVVVLGYNDTLFNIVDSLVEANSNHKKQCVVVVGDKDNEDMNAKIRANVKDHDLKTTRLRCRCGEIYDKNMFYLASVETAKSVIINGKDDKLAIKSLLAVKSYLEENGKDLKNCNKSEEKREVPQVTVVINDKRFYKAAEKVGGNWATVICGKDYISRIIAHSCNQRGLSKVFDELFDYKENEIYFEPIPETEGRRFEEVVFMFGKAIPIGIYSPKKEDGKKVKLNPDPQKTNIDEGDMIIMFEEDDGAYKPFYNEPQKENIQNTLINNETIKSRNMKDLVILGQNDSLNDILEEYASVTSETTTVRIIDTASELKKPIGEYKKIKYKYLRVNDFSADTIKKHIGENDFNVLVLAGYDLDYEEADAESILKLIELKTLAEMPEMKGKDFAITCEIRKSTNKPLAEIIGAENFVISSNIGGLMSVQCAENFRLYEVFDELLSARDSELYMRPVKDFVKLNEEVNFNTILEAALKKKCICLGYYKPKEKKLVTCPKRTDTNIFSEKDTLIILSED